MVEDPRPPASTWRDFLGPRDWPNWVGLAVVRALALLPLPVIWLAGSLLGEILYLLLPRRRYIAATNVRACFPALTPAARARLVRANFRAFARTVLLTPVVWWGSPRRLARLVCHRHREHYDQALAQGRSIILLAPHFTGLEAGGVSLAPERLMVTMYKRPKNRFWDRHMHAGRGRFGGLMVERDEELRALIRRVREGWPFYYLPDQDPGRRQAVFAPFFGIPTATLITVSRIARMTDAAVIPCITRERTSGFGYELEFGPPLADFPSGDDLRDAAVVNAVIEQAARAAPEQYFWQHRRFKTRPEGEGDFYAS